MTRQATNPEIAATFPWKRRQNIAVYILRATTFDDRPVLSGLNPIVPA
jgi:hypothetical protein